MTKKHRIGIIDDHDIVRKGIKELLHNMRVFEVVEEYGNGVAFLQDLEQKEETPDLYILDYSMPMINGIQVLKEARETQPDAKFLLLTQHLNDALKIEAYDAGSRGFLNKTCTAAQLKSSIENVIKLGYDNFEEILRLLRSQKLVANLSAQQRSDLSAREFHLLELVCSDKEYTYQEIADLMNISVKTVDACRAVMFQKLGVKSKVGLVLYSFRHQLTAPFAE